MQNISLLMIINFTFLLLHNFYTILYYLLYHYTSEDCAEGIQQVKYIKLIDYCCRNMYGLEARVNMDTQRKRALNRAFNNYLAIVKNEYTQGLNS